MWQITVRPSVEKSFKKIDIQNRRKILDYLFQKVGTLKDPRSLGKPLTGSFKGLWRYRVGDYRIIVRIVDKELEIVALRIGHRKDIYDN